jgi:hypothetical protein
MVDSESATENQIELQIRSWRETHKSYFKDAFVHKFLKSSIHDSILNAFLRIVIFPGH